MRNTYKLRDLLTIKNGKDHKHLNDGMIPVYGSGGIMRNVDEYLYDGTSVLLPRKGTLQNIQYVQGKFWTVDTTFYTIINKNLVDPYFLYSFLNNLDLSGYDTGASIPSMTSKTYYGIKISIPYIETQRKIASILSVYDELIENNNKRIKTLETMADSLYKEWFVRFRFPGYENVEHEEWLPKGWHVSRLKEFGRIETGKTPSTLISEYYDGIIPFIKTPDMVGDFVIKTSETLTIKGSESQIKKLLPSHSIVVSCIGTGGVVSINSIPSHTNQQINAIILNNQNELEWIYFVCVRLKETINMFGATGATMTNLSKSKFENLKIINPGKELIHQFHKVTGPLIKKIEKIQYIIENLKRQRDLLLPRLMSGKLEVKERE